ncbi:hypothetical protein CVT24_011331 [Panaeolus cyanescens]|uniref:Uncharacterized protein n=1 Tax=Panaeolus cyanescens TaxID=181874 RepID=A0A409YV41_9AGAR|nr:hypothetical protein CVT24_011331 [Panaeolus cyanescens]
MDSLPFDLLSSGPCINLNNMSMLARSTAISHAVTIPLDDLIQVIRLKRQLARGPINTYGEDEIPNPETGSKEWEIERDLRLYLAHPVSVSPVRQFGDS